MLRRFGFPISDFYILFFFSLLDLSLSRFLEVPILEFSMFWFFIFVFQCWASQLFMSRTLPPEFQCWLLLVLGSFHWSCTTTLKLGERGFTVKWLACLCDDVFGEGVAFKRLQCVWFSPWGRSHKIGGVAIFCPPTDINLSKAFVLIIHILTYVCKCCNILSSYWHQFIHICTHVRICSELHMHT